MDGSKFRTRGTTDLSMNDWGTQIWPIAMSGVRLIRKFIAKELFVSLVNHFRLRGNKDQQGSNPFVPWGNLLHSYWTFSLLIYLWKMVIFHRYVSLPEGKPSFSYGFPMVNLHFLFCWLVAMGSNVVYGGGRELLGSRHG